MAKYLLDTCVINTILKFRDNKNNINYSFLFRRENNTLVINWCTIYELLSQNIDPHGEKILQLGEFIREKNVKIAFPKEHDTISGNYFRLDEMTYDEILAFFEQIKGTYVKYLSQYIADIAHSLGTAIINHLILNCKIENQNNTAGTEFLKQYYNNHDMFPILTKALTDTFLDHSNTKFKNIIENEIKEYIISLLAFGAIDNPQNFYEEYTKNKTKLESDYADYSFLKICDKKLGQDFPIEKIVQFDDPSSDSCQFLLWEIQRYKNGKEKIEINDMIDFDNFMVAYKNECIYLSEDKNFFSYINNNYSDEKILKFCNNSRDFCTKHGLIKPNN